jgi:hypothetical protein
VSISSVLRLTISHIVFLFFDTPASKYTVTWRLKAGIWPSDRQRFAKHISVVTRNRTLLDDLVNTFSWQRINTEKQNNRGTICGAWKLVQSGGDSVVGLGNLESETVKCDHESRGTRTREWLRWRGPAAIVNDRPILLSKRLVHKNYDRKGSFKKISGRESQGLGAKTKWLVVNCQS